MGEFVRVATVDEIPPGEMKIVEIDGNEVAVANTGDGFHAFQNDCTHRQGPLGEGILTGEIVECPFHAGKFNVKTGEVVEGPPSEPIATYAVQVDGNEIRVEKG